MADMSLDELLSSSIKSAAEPAASKGVADAIRARVAAGDTGTVVAGSTAPGWGGSAAGIMTIAAPIALIVAAGTVGGVLGATGVFGAPIGDAAGPRPYSAVVDDSVAGLDCPGGTAVTDLYPGQHVLAIARSGDSDFLAVRDPAALDSSVWVDVSAVTMDDDIAGLPVSGCGELIVETPTPTPEASDPTPNPSNTTAPPPPPPAETTPPMITKMSATPTLIINGQPTQISVTASDNVGVTGVQLSWAIAGNNGSGSMTGGGGVWTYVYSDNDLNDGFGNIVFTARAIDAAGNLSAPVQVVVNRQYLG